VLNWSGVATEMLPKEFWGANEFFLLGSWILCKNTRFEYLIPHLQLVFSALYFTLLNLGYRGYLPDWFFEFDSKHHQAQFYLILFLFNIMNYNTFMYTLIFTPAVFMVPNYYLLKFEAS